MNLPQETLGFRRACFSHAVIKDGLSDFGVLWTAQMTEDGAVLCFERGYEYHGNVPQVLKNALSKTTLNAYRVKFLPDGSYFFADEEGHCSYNL